MSRKKPLISPKKLAVLAFLLAVSMIFSYVESLIPLSLGAPGIKMGLPNIITVFLLYTLGKKEAILVSLLRVLLTALLFGNLFSLIYSLSGAVLSFLVMALLQKTGLFRTVTVSVTGACAHNLAQILAAMVILGFKEILYYLPYLLLSGVVSGIIIGIVSAVFIRRFKGLIQL